MKKATLKRHQDQGSCYISSHTRSLCRCSRCCCRCSCCCFGCHFLLLLLLIGTVAYPPMDARYSAGSIFFIAS